MTASATRISFGLGAAVFIASSPLLAEDYNFTDPNGRNTVALLLDAPFESIRGVANGVEGHVKLENDVASGRFRVRVDSIKTGNTTRDQHLTEENWMNAKKWPYVIFSFENIALPKDFKNGKEHKVTADGSFSIHGVRKTQSITLRLRYLKESELTKKRLLGNLVRVRADFKLRLADYNIAQSDSKLKALVGLKVGETAELNIDFFGSDQGTALRTKG